MKALLVACVFAGLACLGCGGDLNPSAPSLTSRSLGLCQTGGSTVGILDQAPGC